MRETAFLSSRISLVPHALIARAPRAYRFCPLSDKQSPLPLIARQPLGYRTFSSSQYLQIVIIREDAPISFRSSFQTFHPHTLNFPDSQTGQSLIALLNVIVHFSERRCKYRNYNRNFQGIIAKNYI